MNAIDLSEWRKVLVTGSDAHDWLEDLISAGISGLPEDEPRRSLLLTPTGRIRADFHVIPDDGGDLLVQDPVQAKPIDLLLASYVLSSDVQLSAVETFTVARWDGDTLHPVDEAANILDERAFNEWRIHEGIPRFGVDLDEDSLPQEAGWERFIDFTKGCFMGQEAMARIRNFEGHPTRVVKAMRADQPASAGGTVVADGKEVGLVTSAEDADVIVRVNWNARDATLETASGVSLSDRA